MFFRRVFQKIRSIFLYSFEIQFNILTSGLGFAVNFFSHFYVSIHHNKLMKGNKMILSKSTKNSLVAVTALAASIVSKAKAEETRTDFSNTQSFTLNEDQINSLVDVDSLPYKLNKLRDTLRKDKMLLAAYNSNPSVILNLAGIPTVIHSKIIKLGKESADLSKKYYDDTVAGTACSAFTCHTTDVAKEGWILPTAVLDPSSNSNSIRFMHPQELLGTKTK